MKKLMLLVATLALFATACGDDTAALPINDGAAPDPAATCPVGEPNCNDTPGGIPTDLPLSGDDQPSIAISVVEAINMTGPAVVTGFLVDSGGDLRLCEALAESFPPQCGGESIALNDNDQVDPDDLQVEGSVIWTDSAVTISGEIANGALVATPIE